MSRAAAIVVLISALVPAFAGENHSGFSGKWQLEPPPMESVQLKQNQIPAATLIFRVMENGLEMETIRMEAGSSVPFHEILHLRLDGSETSEPGDAGVLVTGKARWQGAKLVVDTARNVNDATVTTHCIYSLSADGSNLTVDKSLTVQHGYQGQSAKTTGTGSEVFVRSRD